MSWDDPGGKPNIVNPWDEYALEAGIQLKETHGGQVTALCLGQPQAAEALKSALAMGADEAILISDPALDDSDSLVTARVLAAAINKIADANGSAWVPPASATTITG